MKRKKYPIVLGAATFEGTIDKNDKVIITLRFSPKGAIFTSGLRIWVRTRSGTYRQIGLIHNLRLTANAKRFLARLSMAMSEDHEGLSPVSRKILARNKKELRNMGVEIVEKKTRM